MCVCEYYDSVCASVCVYVYMATSFSFYLCEPLWSYDSHHSPTPLRDSLAAEPVQSREPVLREQEEEEEGESGYSLINTHTDAHTDTHTDTCNNAGVSVDAGEANDLAGWLIGMCMYECAGLCA
jgi:hypothetical protein